MNPSERLHKQGEGEQFVTPELKLSMELWDTCEKLLREKGKNVLFFFKIAFFELKDMEQRACEPGYGHGTVWSGTNLNRAKLIRVNIPGMHNNQNNHDISITNLRLKKQQIGEIGDAYWNEGRQEKRPATIEELTAYQSYINRSSPIEHK